MIIGLHGTTLSAALSIQKFGYSPKSHNWLQSDGGMYVFIHDGKYNSSTLALRQAMPALVNSPEFKHEKLAFVVVDLTGIRLEDDIHHSSDGSKRVVDTIESERIISVYGEKEPLPLTLKFLWLAKALTPDIILNDTLPHVPEVRMYKSIIKSFALYPNIYETELKKYSGDSILGIPSKVYL